MSRVAAIFTSDPSLVRCELDRVREKLALADLDDAVGVGAYQDDVVLQRHYGTGATHADVWEVPPSDAVMLAAGVLPPGQALADSAQPFRFRQWLFAFVGQVDGAARVRERLLAELPEFLQRAVRGSTLGEVAFHVFLSELRGLGRMEDPSLGASTAAQLLLKCARTIEQTSAAVGGTEKSKLGLVATNGRLLVAARRGDRLMSFALLEGERTCARCELTGQESDSLPEVRDHRRRRSVVVASDPLPGGPFQPIPDGGAIAVDRKLSLQTLSGG